MASQSEIQCLLERVWKLRGENNYKESKKLLEEVQSIASENDFNLQGRIFHIYMQYEYDHNNLAAALDYNNKSISFYTKANNLDRIAHSTRHRVDLERQLDDFDKSKASYQRCIDIYKNIPECSKGDLANALRGFGLLLEKQGLNKKAIRVWEEIIDLYSGAKFADGVEEANHKIIELKSGLDKADFIN